MRYTAVGRQHLSDEIFIEVAAAGEAHGDHFASLHEAYAVLLEEVDEVWDIVKLKRSKRDPQELRAELIQVAAMAIKAIQTLDMEPKRFVG